MNTWTRQVGYPLVTVKVDDGHVIARQTRFLTVIGNNTLLPKEEEEPKKNLRRRWRKEEEEDKKKKKYDEVLDSNSPINKTIGYKWHVPLTYVTSAKPRDAKMVWMNLTDVEFEVGHDLKWVKFNVGQRGFYRVNYEARLWSALTAQLMEDHRAISSADRASLIDDVFSLAR